MTGVYLYQTVHILDGNCRFLPEHLSLLDSWSRRIFSFRFSYDTASIASAIEHEAARQAPPCCDRSLFVRISLCESGETSCQYAGVSLYRGYALRSLRPNAVCFTYDPPLFEAPTSVYEAAEKLARQQARLAGAHTALRCNREGIALTADSAPLFAVKGSTVYTSPALQSVERSLAFEIIGRAGLELIEQPVSREQLPFFDELFFFDHRGITALGHCNGQPYMDIVANRIGRTAEKI